MRHRRLARLVFALAGSLAAATPTLADTTCNARSLAGNWILTLTVSLPSYYDNSGRFVPPQIYINHCSTRISGSGAVSGNCYNTGGGWTFPLSGNARVDSACVLRGRLRDPGTFFDMTAQVGSTAGRQPTVITGTAATPEYNPIGYLPSQVSAYRLPSSFQAATAPATMPDMPAVPEGMSPSGIPLRAN